MFTEEQKQNIIEYLDRTPGNVYIGCDSVKRSRTAKDSNGKPIKDREGRPKKEWYAEYNVVLSVHINNSNGAKIFHYREKELDFDEAKKPRQRLLNEVSRAIELYLEFEDYLIEREVEIHLDVNPDEDFASSAVAKQAKGMVLGITGIDPQLKPDAFAGSYAADHVARNKPM